jgi:hypothetical protein
MILSNNQINISLLYYQVSKDYDRGMKLSPKRLKDYEVSFFIELYMYYTDIKIISFIN